MGVGVRPSSAVVCCWSLSVGSVVKPRRHAVVRWLPIVANSGAHDQSQMCIVARRVGPAWDIVVAAADGGRGLCLLSL